MNSILATQGLIAVLTFAINVALFRELGAEGKGAYTLFVLVTMFASGTATLGVGLANLYFVGQGRYSLPQLVAGSELLVGAAALLVVAVVAVMWIAGAGDISGTPSLWLYALSVPLVLQFAYLMPLLQARHQFGVLGLATACIPAVTLGGIGLLQAFDSLTAGRAVAVWAASYGAANVIGATGIGWHVFVAAFPFWPSNVLRAQLRFGLQGELGNVLQLVNYRFDQLVVAAYGGATDVGIYSVAIAVAESLWLISTAVVMVLTPRLTSATAADAADFAPFVCRTVLLGNGLLALAIAAASPFLLEAVFGSDAGSSVAPTLWLLPGVVAMSGGLTLSSYVFSRGRPILTTVSTAATVVVTLILDLVLIPRFGIQGAAAASSVAYIATFGLLLFWFRRLSGRPAWTAVLVRPADLPRYADAARGATARVRSAVARGGQ